MPAEIFRFWNDGFLTLRFSYFNSILMAPGSDVVTTDVLGPASRADPLSNGEDSESRRDLEAYRSDATLQNIFKKELK